MNPDEVERRLIALERNSRSSFSQKVKNFKTDTDSGIKSCHVEGAGKVALKLSSKALMKSKLGNKLLLGGAGKFLLNTQVAKSILKSQIVTKVCGKSAGEMIGKKIPLLSFVLGLGFGIQRFWNGDWVKGGFEIASGTIACLPGYGTAASVGIDVMLLGHDIKLSLEEREKIIEQTTNDAYELLNLQRGATKQEVDAQARSLLPRVHPDQNMDLSELEIKQFEEITKAVNEARSWIYEINKW